MCGSIRFLIAILDWRIAFYVFKYSITTLRPHHFQPPSHGLSSFPGGTPSKRMSVWSILGWDGQTGHLETIFYFIANIIECFEYESTSSLGEFKELAGFCTSFIKVPW